LKIKKEEGKKSEIRKFDFSVTYIKTIIGFTSILFLISGYIYNHLFLGYFGIEVSKFFTLKDYISTSIDKIYSIVIILIINIVINYFWWSPDYRKRRREMSKGRLFFEDAPFFFLFLIIPFLAIVSSSFNLPGKYFFLGFTIFIVFQYFVSKVIIFFKKPFLAHLIISYIGLFFLILISGTLEDGNIIKYHTKNDLNYFVEFDTSIDIEPKKLYLLSANSNFSFFYSIENKQSYVVPNKNIKIITKKYFEKKGFFENIIDLLIFSHKKDNNLDS
jgi:hypothetical protein